MNSDFSFHQFPEYSNNELMTKTIMKYTVLPYEENIIDQVITPSNLDAFGDDELNNNNNMDVSSDEGESMLDGDNFMVQNPLYCKNCGRLFMSENYLKNHTASKRCRPMENKITIEGRAIKILEKMLADKTLTIHSRYDSIEHVAPLDVRCEVSYTDYFWHGWAARPKHGHTKGHTYMTPEYKKLIKQYFMVGANDKGKKMSAALMFEALQVESEKEGMHPRSKHYLPHISEISIVISQLSTAQKKNIM